MPGYKLTYYDSRGLMEPARIMFAYAKVDFEDIRIPITGFPQVVLPQEIKDKCPWGQVPLLEFADGKKLAKSLTITRFIAKRFNLVGADDYEAAKCDEYVDTIKDLSKDFFSIFVEKDEAKKAEMLKALVDDISTKYLTEFNDIVAGNGGKRLVGQSLTWADIFLAHTLSNAEMIFKIDLFSRFPALKSLEQTVFADPQIKAWVEKRPKTLS